MISERMLKKWRKESLKRIENFKSFDASGDEMFISKENDERILKMSQELMDLHLMKGK